MATGLEFRRVLFRSFEPTFERISIRSDFDSLFLKFISDQIQTETTGRNNFTVLIKNAVVGNTVFYLKNSSDILIGRSYFLGIRQESDPAKNHENKKQPFHMYDLIYPIPERSEEHTSELQSRGHIVCRLLLEKKKKN